MSYHEYMVSRQLDAQGLPFYALIMAAMRKADTTNANKLAAMFPETWNELQERYHAPEGKLEGERQ